MLRSYIYSLSNEVMFVFVEIMGGGTCSYSGAVPGASSMSGMEIGFLSNPPLSDHRRRILLCDCLLLTDMKPPRFICLKSSVVICIPSVMLVICCTTLPVSYIAVYSTNYYVDCPDV